MREVKNPWVIAWATMLGIAASTFPITVFSASLPEVAADFNTSESTISWVLSAPLLAMAIFTPMAGRYGDINGHRNAYLGGFFLATAFAFLTAAAWDPFTLITFRTISQAAAAATGPASVAIILHNFPAAIQSRALGYWSAVTAVSPALGVAVGGPLIDLIGWRFVFMVQGIISVGAIIFGYFVIPDTPRRTGQRYDLPGAFELAITIAALMIGVNRGVEWGWTHPAALVPLLAAPLVLVFFVITETRNDTPFMPMQWFKKSNYSSLLFVSFITNGIYLGSFALTPFLLDRIFGYGVTIRSVILTIRPFLFAAGAALGGRYGGKVRIRTIIFTGTALLAFSCVALGLASLTETLVFIFMGLMTSGFGFGYIRPALISAVGASVKKEDMGVGTGAMNTVGLIGASVGTTIMLSLAGAETSTEKFWYIYLGAASLTAVAVVSCYWITPRKTPTDD